MKLAYIYDNGEIVVEFKPSDFRELLKSYMETYKNIDVALKKVEEDIKKALLKS